MQYFRIKYSTIQYNTVQYTTLQYSAVHYSTVQYSTVQYSTVQYTTLQYSAVHYSTVQYSTVQYSTVQYTTLQHTVQYNTLGGAHSSYSSFFPVTAAGREEESLDCTSSSLVFRGRIASSILLWLSLYSLGREKAAVHASVRRVSPVIMAPT